MAKGAKTRKTSNKLAKIKATTSKSGAKPKKSAHGKLHAKSSVKAVKKAKGKDKIKDKVKATSKTKLQAKPKVTLNAKSAAKKATSTKVSGKTTQATKRAATSVSKKTQKVPAAQVHNFVSPLDDRVLIRFVEMSEVTPGGLYIPDSATQKPSEGEVVAVGPGKRTKKGARRQPDVVIGDRVMFGEYGGLKVDLLGETFLILREDEILGVVG